jgi:hypothetical protein
MGDVPVLKPQEVAAILAGLGSFRYANVVRTASIDIRMVA